MRETFWDAAKGISIIAVVIIHSTSYLLKSGSVYDDIGLIFRQVLNFAVPVFLFIAGYFSFSTKKISNVDYLISRSVRILPPYIFWSLIFFLASTFILGQSFDIRKLISGLIFGTSIGIGYFVIVLIQFTIITLIIKKIQNRKTHINLIILFSLIGIIYTYLTKLLLPNHILSAFPFSALPFFVWYPFFHFGYYLSMYKPEVRLRYSAIPLLILFFLLTIAEGYLLKNLVNIDFGASQIKLSSFILSLFICILIYQYRKNQVSNKTLIFLGLNSYGIYLIHMLFISFFNKFLSRIWINGDFKLSGVLILTILSLLLSIITIQIIKKVLKSKSKYIIG